MSRKLEVISALIGTAVAVFIVWNLVDLIIESLLNP